MIKVLIDSLILSSTLAFENDDISRLQYVQDELFLLA